MYKIFRNRKILLCALLPDLASDEITLEKYKEARGLYLEDPWERVKTIFSTDDFGNWHPEVIHAIHMAQYGFFGGLVFGGLTETRKELERFFRTNDANIYMNKKEAYRKLNNQSLLAAVKGGYKWCPTFALFFGTYSLISSCSEQYRNKVDILDNIIAGMSVGALYRFMFGLKGMVAGAFFGSIAGIIYGTAFWGLSKLTKKDGLEIKYAQFMVTKYREELNRGKKKNDQDLEIIHSELHGRHTFNPLDMLEDKKEDEKKEKNLNEKQNK